MFSKIKKNINNFLFNRKAEFRVGKYSLLVFLTGLIIVILSFIFPQTQEIIANPPIYEIVTVGLISPIVASVGWSLLLLGTTGFFFAIGIARSFKNTARKELALKQQDKAAKDAKDALKKYDASSEQLAKTK